MRELDRWEGKLTWPLFCERVAKVLNVASISKHTMYLYPAVKERFQQRQRICVRREARCREISHWMLLPAASLTLRLK